jgi:hypothetical protein
VRFGHFDERHAGMDRNCGPPLQLGRFIPSQAAPLVVNGRTFLSTPYGRVVESVRQQSSSDDLLNKTIHPVHSDSTSIA